VDLYSWPVSTSKASPSNSDASYTDNKSYSFSTRFEYKSGADTMTWMILFPQRIHLCLAEWRIVPVAWPTTPYLYNSLIYTHLIISHLTSGFYLQKKKKVTRYGLDDRDSISRRGRDFSLRHIIGTGSGIHPVSLSSRALSSQGKAAEKHEAHHSHPCSLTSSPPYPVIKHRGNFIFHL